jgi:septal ring factor EnvC (AmiA/AmiB activator)
MTYARTNGENHARPEERRGLRNVVGFLVVALAVGAGLLVLEFWQELRVFTDPALDDLLRAQSHVSRSYGPQEDMLSESQKAQRELNAAIDLLAAAEQADPAASKKIDDLRARLEALKDEQRVAAMTREELRASYQELRDELKRLIDARLERGPPSNLGRGGGG